MLQEAKKMEREDYSNSGKIGWVVVKADFRYFILLLNNNFWALKMYLI